MTTGSRRAWDRSRRPRSATGSPRPTGVSLPCAIGEGSTRRIYETTSTIVAAPIHSGRSKRNGLAKDEGSTVAGLT